MSTISLGDLVEGDGLGTGTRYRGRLVSFPRPGRKAYGIMVTWVAQQSQGSTRPGSFASITNVRKVEEMAYINNLIGVEPEPVKAPKFVAPFTSDGRNVVDKNGRVVARIVKGDYQTSAYQTDLPMAEAYELARVIAEALTAKFQKTATDAPSPF